MNAKILSFEPKLIEAVALRRRNRFLIDALVEGTSVVCHCPSTGTIGGLVIQDLPCLMSVSGNEKRKTPCTVEAISLDLPDCDYKNWIGINQVAVNRYVRAGAFHAIVGEVADISWEKKLGNSKLDIFVGTMRLAGVMKGETLSEIIGVADIVSARLLALDDVHPEDGGRYRI